MIGVFVQVNTTSMMARAKPIGYVVCENGCWEWVGAQNGTGYGIITQQHRNYLAHRVFYEREYGPIPPDLECDHLCRNRLCVRPDHIELVPHPLNVRRGQSPAAMQAKQTACQYGHPFDATNTYLWHGKRRCRQCTKLRMRLYYKPHPRPPITHCPRGHPYDEANTYRKPDGRRCCRICRRAQGLARYYSQKS